MTGLPTTGAFIILNATSEAKRRAARTLPSARQREEEVRAKQPNKCSAERNSAHTTILISCRATGTQICLKRQLRWSCIAATHHRARMALRTMLVNLGITLWCSVGGAKNWGIWGCPMRFTTGCPCAIRINETRNYLILQFHGDHGPHPCAGRCRA